MKEQTTKKEDIEKEEIVKVKERKKKQKADFSYEEIQEKFARTFNAVTLFLKVDVEYKSEDFEEEAKDIVRMSEKYQIIGIIITFLDPLFLVLGLLSKVKNIVKKMEERKKEDKKEVE